MKVFAEACLSLWFICFSRFMVSFKIGTEKLYQLCLENGMKACITLMETTPGKGKVTNLCQMPVCSGSEARLPRFPLDTTSLALQSH